MDVNVDDEPRIWPAKLLDPAVPCPRCGTGVQGFVSCRSYFAGGTITRQEAVEGVPASKLRGAMLYRLHPCSCEIDQFWMSAFAEEMGRRQAGKPPRNVEGRSAANRKQLTEELQSRIRALYSKRDAAVVAGMTARKAAVEREVVLLVTELARAEPSLVAQVPPITMEAEVLQWAAQGGLTTPPGSGEPDTLVRLTLQQIHSLLATDPDLGQGLPARKLLTLATAMHKELQDFATKGRPVSRATLQAVERLVPHAGTFIQAREVDGPELDDPEHQFADEFARRRRRRLDVRKDPDTDHDE